MNRQELVQKLLDFSAEDIRRRGTESLLILFRWYFSDVVEDDFEHTGILPYLPKLVVDAVEIFSDESNLPPDIADARTQYLKDTEVNDIPLLTTIGYGGISRVMVITHVSGIMEVVTGHKFVQEQIQAYCFAEDTVLTQAFYRFFKQVGEKGLWDIYDASSCGCSGTFGETDLRIGESAGRIMVTFVQRKEGTTTYEPSEISDGLELPYIEEQITFIGDSSYRNTPSWGIQSCHASFSFALEMIEQVIENWPEDVNDQKEIFKSNTDITLA